MSSLPLSTATGDDLSFRLVAAADVTSRSSYVICDVTYSKRSPDIAGATSAVSESRAESTIAKWDDVARKKNQVDVNNCS